MSESGRVRLQKFLASAGLGSRRACEGLIEEGRVTIDGKKVQSLGVSVDLDTQTVAYDGQVLKPERHVYYAVYKPVDYVCSNRSQGGLKRAIDLVRKPSGRLFCVGRLDVASEGLLLVTNDGEFSNWVTHPRHKIPKTYRVSVKGSPSPDAIKKIRQGIWLAEGKTAPARVKIVRKARETTTLLITIIEGKNRLLRRVLAKVDLRVKKLVRIQIGSIRLDKLRKGQFRTLTRAEIQSLQDVATTAPSEEDRTQIPSDRRFNKPSDGDSSPRGSRKKKAKTTRRKATKKGTKKVAKKFGRKVGKKKATRRSTATRSKKTTKISGRKSGVRSKTSRRGPALKKRGSKKVSAKRGRGPSRKSKGSPRKRRR